MPPPLSATTIEPLIRCEQTWGITPVPGGRPRVHPGNIDTASEDSMLPDLGRNMVDGALGAARMARVHVGARPVTAIS